MAEIKLSQLPVANNISINGDPLPTKNDLFMIVQNGANKKIAWDTMLSHMNRPVIINSNKSVIPFTVRGNNVDYLIHAYTEVNKVGINTQSPAELFHVNGNVKIGSASADGVCILSSEYKEFTDAPGSEDSGGVNDKIAINVGREITSIVPKGNCYFTLGPGTPNQKKVIVYSNSVGTGNTCNITVDPSGVGVSNIVLLSKTASVTLIYTNVSASSYGWFVIGQSGSVTITS